jgi:hypothetical protein
VNEQSHCLTWSIWVNSANLLNFWVRWLEFYFTELNKPLMQSSKEDSVLRGCLKSSRWSHSPAVESIPGSSNKVRFNELKTGFWWGFNPFQWVSPTSPEWIPGQDRIEAQRLFILFKHPLKKVEMLSFQCDDNTIILHSWQILIVGQKWEITLSLMLFYWLRKGDPQRKSHDWSGSLTIFTSKR